MGAVPKLLCPVDRSRFPTATAGPEPPRPASTGRGASGRQRNRPARLPAPPRPGSAAEFPSQPRPPGGRGGPGPLPLLTGAPPAALPSHLAPEGRSGWEAALRGGGPGVARVRAGSGPEPGEAAVRPCRARPGEGSGRRDGRGPPTESSSTCCTHLSAAKAAGPRPAQPLRLFLSLRHLPLLTAATRRGARGSRRRRPAPSAASLLDAAPRHPPSGLDVDW